MSEQFEICIWSSEERQTGSGVETGKRLEQCPARGGTRDQRSTMTGSEPRAGLSHPDWCQGQEGPCCRGKYVSGLSLSPLNI